MRRSKRITEHKMAEQALHGGIGRQIEERARLCAPTPPPPKESLPGSSVEATSASRRLLFPDVMPDVMSLLVLLRCARQAKVPHISNLKSVRGIVTHLCTDYGWINESIFFNPDMVCGNVPVNVGMSVIALVEEDETTHALKTIKVKAVSDPIYGIEPSEFDKRLCIKCVTYTTRDNIYISEETFFPMQLLSGGFLPFKGDLLLVEYSLKQGTLNITINTVRFLNCQNMDEVCITSTDGKTGVVESCIFFTVDSLQKPSDYTPGLYDIVNVVAVDSIQPHCSWRAVSMIPVEMCIDQAL
ncbi:cancer/testis antigen 55-like [Peromyscus californicus insignis]|uniref:cancer/testis antigen 55-like n=1 Tax=Peromyscus californicus insignis TaxID=564181 RepID=UPI0022A809F0|nr:cancer/testis antigen 55-like [Peromyscus californicus insignis]